MNYKILKRFLDVIISFFALIVLSPLLLLVSIIIRVTSEGNAIFKQERIGKDKKVFKIYKFRSMKVNSEHTGSGVYSGANDDRVTPIGKIIRATSIDELPQLINVLKGEMSFIGPRPPLTYHPWTIDKYTSEQLHYFDARPGITGWAQVNGRKNVEWNERINLSIWYNENMSLLLDIKIIFKTILGVLKNEENLSDGNTVKDNKDA